MRRKWTKGKEGRGGREGRKDEREGAREEGKEGKEGPWNSMRDSARPSTAWMSRWLVGSSMNMMCGYREER